MTQCTCQTGPWRYSSGCPVHDVPVTDPDTGDTRREDEPGDWCVADFDGECSRGQEQIVPGTTIRADSDGGWECRGCVNEDEADSPWNVHGEDPYAVGGAA